MKNILLLLLLLLLIPLMVFAHPGNLDSNGGHWNYYNGTYHYHQYQLTDYVYYEEEYTKDELYSKIEILNEEKSYLESDIEDLKGDIASLKTEIQELTAENKELSETVETYDLYLLWAFFAIFGLFLWANIERNNKKEQKKQYEGLLNVYQSKQKKDDTI